MNILTYNTLFKTSMTLEPVPDLVDSYENVDDSTWHFKIKEGVKFHNGDTMTIDDVVASLQWAQGFAEVSLYNKNFVSISKVDDQTLEIKTDSPDAMVLSNLCHQDVYKRQFKLTSFLCAIKEKSGMLVNCLHFIDFYLSCQ